jgi:uncharacterized membrane protein
MYRLYLSSTLCLGLVLLAPAQAFADPMFSTYVSFGVPGSAASLGQGINDNRDVAGQSRNAPDFVPYGFVRFANGAFSSPIIDANSADGYTFATGINNADTVVGSYLQAGTDAVHSHGFILQAGSYTEYDIAGSMNTNLAGINNLGHLTGFCDTGSFLDTGGSISIFTAGGIFTQANGVNDLDQVVGTYEDAMSNFHGFLRNPNGAITPFDVPGASSTFASGINDAGEIVGTYATPSNSEQGFILDQGVFFTFNFPGAGTTVILGINNNGDITGEINGEEAAFIAVAATAAAPEPGAMILLSAGCLTLGAGRLAQTRSRILSRCQRSE